MIEMIIDKRAGKQALGRLNKILKNSQNVKIKSGWSREGGAGFIKEDLRDVGVCLATNEILIEFLGGMNPMTVKSKDLNLRETEELLKFIGERYE